MVQAPVLAAPATLPALSNGTQLHRHLQASAELGREIDRDPAERAGDLVPLCQHRIADIDGGLDRAVGREIGDRRLHRCCA